MVLFGVRLNAHRAFDLRPGIITSPMTDPRAVTYDDLIAGGPVPARSRGPSKEVGTTVAALVLGQLSFSTGAGVPVESGLGLHRV